MANSVLHLIISMLQGCKYEMFFTNKVEKSNIFGNFLPLFLPPSGKSVNF
nr:MAG TPA: hypothetical protein [Caudoviricetes sp.]